MYNIHMGQESCLKAVFQKCKYFLNSLNDGSQRESLYCHVEIFLKYSTSE